MPADADGRVGAGARPEILCAGKTSEYDFVYDQAAGKVTSLDRATDAAGFEPLWARGNRDIRGLLDARAAALTESQHTGPDLVEMGIVANATGLVPDVPAFHAPIARTQEIADLLVPAEMGRDTRRDQPGGCGQPAPAPR